MSNDLKKRLKQISDARLARIDGDLDWFTTSLRQLASKWEAEIGAILADLPSPQSAARVAYVAELQTELRRQLNTLGYERLAEEFTIRLDGAREQAMETLQALGVQSARLAPLNEGALATLRQIHWDTLVRAGEDAAAEVGRGVILNAVAGRSRADMYRSVSETLDAKLVRYAGTYADTALVSYDRTVSWETWKAAGIDRFLYRGPSDVKTRPFCLDRVGKKYTTDEINAMDNGTRLMPVMIYGGGWNCRHVWTPEVAA